MMEWRISCTLFETALTIQVAWTSSLLSRPNQHRPIPADTVAILRSLLRKLCSYRELMVCIARALLLDMVLNALVV
jgi:hypothetical protein